MWLVNKGLCCDWVGRPGRAWMVKARSWKDGLSIPSDLGTTVALPQHERTQARARTHVDDPPFPFLFFFTENRDGTGFSSRLVSSRLFFFFFWFHGVDWPGLRRLPEAVGILSSDKMCKKNEGVKRRSGWGWGV